MAAIIVFGKEVKARGSVISAFKRRWWLPCTRRTIVRIIVQGRRSVRGSIQGPCKADSPLFSARRNVARIFRSICLRPYLPRSTARCSETHLGAVLMSSNARSARDVACIFSTHQPGIIDPNTSEYSKAFLEVAASGRPAGSCLRLSRFRAGSFFATPMWSYKNRPRDGSTQAGRGYPCGAAAQT